MSESILYNFYTSKAFVFDAFNVSQLIKSGRLDEKNLLEDLQNGMYPIIQLDDKIPETINESDLVGSLEFQGRFSVNSLKMIKKHYTLFHYSTNGYFYCYTYN